MSHVYIVNVYNYNVNYLYHNDIVISVAVTMMCMDLKRVNVVIDAESHQVLLDFQKSKDYASKDKALAELLMEFKKLRKKND